MDKKKNFKNENTVHLHGIIDKVKILDREDGRKTAFVDVATYQAYKPDPDKDEYQRIWTHTEVRLTTDDKKTLAELQKIADDLEKRLEEKKKAGEKAEEKTGEKVEVRKLREVTVDGHFVTRANTTKDNVTYYNNSVVVSDLEDFKLDAQLQEKEARNTATIKGNIASIRFVDKDKEGKALDNEFANVSIATHYYAPAKDPKPDENPWEEKTSYIDTIVSKNRFANRKDETQAGIYDDLKEGRIGVGDLVKMKGQIRNSEYTDKNEVHRYKSVINVSRIDLVAKKKVKAEKEEKAEEKKEVKKAAPRKTAKKANGPKI